MISKDHVQHITLKCTSDNDVPMRDIRLGTDQVLEMINTIKLLMQLVEDQDPAKVPQQLKGLINDG